MSDLRDAVLLLSRAVNCLSAAIAFDRDEHRRTELVREADVCADDARRIAATMEPV